MRTIYLLPPARPLLGIEQPGQVPWPGTQGADLWSMGRCSTGTLARATLSLVWRSLLPKPTEYFPSEAGDFNDLERGPWRRPVFAFLPWRLTAISGQAGLPPNKAAKALQLMPIKSPGVGDTSGISGTFFGQHHSWTPLKTKDTIVPARRKCTHRVMTRAWAHGPGTSITDKLTGWIQNMAQGKICSWIGSNSHS